ncbi:MAG TPA: hypothetical protein VHE13_16835 [Opitutus sp.]|nr:hypothetical protein [Opitutus sp.]
MDARPKSQGKARILLHGAAAGEITAREIERRARELAAIRGQTAAEPDAKDFAQARRELSGGDLPPAPNEDPEARAAITRDPSEPPGFYGHKVEETGTRDEQADAERLAEEGVEEAQHDQMLAARRKARRDEESGG